MWPSCSTSLSRTTPREQQRRQRVVFAFARQTGLDLPRQRLIILNPGRPGRAAPAAAEHLLSYVRGPLFLRLALLLAGARGELRGPLARVELGANARWQPAPSFLLAGGVTWNDIQLDTGDLETVLASGRVNFYFSPLVSWENLVQYDTQSGTVGVNSRFRWALRDGQEVFVVFNQNVEADDLEFTIARSELIAKIGWTFSF